MLTKPSPKSAYHYDSFDDYYNSALETYEERAYEEIENDEVPDDVIEQLIEDNYQEIVDWLYSTGRIYDYLVSYYKEQWEMDQEP